MNSIVDPLDPDYCPTCGGECTTGTCKTEFEAEIREIAAATGNPKAVAFVELLADSPEPRAYCVRCGQRFTADLFWPYCTEGCATASAREDAADPEVT